MKRRGASPAIEEVKFSLVSNRGVLRRLLLLRPDLPSGADRPDPKPRIHPPGSGNHGEGQGFQGLHPRRRRPHRQFPPPGLRKAAIQGCLRRAAVPVPHPLQKHERRPLGLCCPAAQAAETPRRQKGVRPQRHPLRLSAGGQEGHLFPGAGAVPRFRSAESRPGACVRRRPRPDGQAPKTRCTTGLWRNILP